jgi:hypothetical protein
MYLPRDVKGLDHGQKFVHQSIRLRNNENRDDKAIFQTSFNSSSVFSEAIKQGEATISVEVALVYPEEYKYDKNWFKTETSVRV